MFLTTARASIAGIAGTILLLLLRQPRPQLSDIKSLVITAIGVVVGFPLLTALALQYVTSAHSIVFLGLLPLCTAIFAVLRAGERLGYAEGGHLSLKLGGWQVISWALLISLPIMLPLALFTMPETFSHVTASGWTGFTYVSLFSMLIGFVFWYRGLAQGGIAAVGQLQLFQPFIGLAISAALLHETVSWQMIAMTLGAVVCVAGAKKYAN